MVDASEEPQLCVVQLWLSLIDLVSTHPTYHRSPSAIAALTNLQTKAELWGCCGSELSVTSLWKIHEAINSYCGLAQASLSAWL